LKIEPWEMKLIAKYTKTVAHKKSIKPILSMVRLRSFDVMLWAEATDLQTNVRVEFNNQRSRNDPEEDLLLRTEDVQALAKLPGTLHISPKNPKDGKNSATVEVTSGRSKLELLTMPAEDFPEVIPHGKEPILASAEQNVSAEALKQAIDEVYFCASQDAFMGNLHGIFLDADGDTLRIVAADGFRLATKEIELSKEGFHGSVLVGLPFINLYRSQGESYGLFVDGNTVSTAAAVDSDKSVLLEVTSRLPGFNFPDYKRVIPAESLHSVEVNPADMIKALETVSFIAGDEAVRIEVGSEMKIYSQNSGRGRAESFLPADGKLPFVIGFNPRFLLDGLARFAKSPKVRLDFVDQNSPLVIEDPAAKWKNIIMPVRLA